ncbi:hypothetical protein KAI92_03815 [Candidatus Parcubacteria bacterium]|nr:hypothetical protein [Candidatus Parcubacteria bacterium]
MSEKEIKENKKFGWKKKVIIIFTIFIVSGCLYYSGKAFLHYAWKTSLRYKNNVACFVGEGCCGNMSITKEEFVREMKQLELSKKEIFLRAILAKKKLKEECVQGKHRKLVCEQRFIHLNNILKHLSEIPD